MDSLMPSPSLVQVHVLPSTPFPNGRLSPMATTESGMSLFDPVTIDRLAADLAVKRPASARI
jgi:hypothetical protein